MTTMSNQKNPILSAQWGETRTDGDVYVTRVTGRRKRVRLRTASATWIPNWFGSPFPCFCARHKS